MTLMKPPPEPGPAPGEDVTWQGCMRAGSTLAGSGQHAAAAAAFSRALQACPGHAPTTGQFAAALLRAGEHARALSAFDTALQLAPAHTGYLQGRALALCGLGETGPALETFRRAAAISPAAWTAWASIADITPDEAERVSALRHAAEALETLCQNDDAPPALFAACSDALINAHRFEEAARFARAHRARFRSPFAAGNALARALYYPGHFREAFRHKARALARLTPSDLPAASPVRAFSPGAAVVALREVMDILTAAGAAPFLAAGTLLGFHRSGGPLAHDRDVDIGIIRNTDGSPDIAGLLRAHPRLLLPRAARPGDRYFGIMFRGIAIDIFLHDARGGALLCGLGNLKGDIQWRFTAFGLARRDYQGEAWTIPDDPERYLAETYGPGWRTPDKGFASAVSSPALHQADDDTRAYYAAARAANALLSGDSAKAQALRRQSPLPFTLPALAGAGPGGVPDTEGSPMA